MNTVRGLFESGKKNTFQFLLVYYLYLSLENEDFMQCLPQKFVLNLSNWLRHKASCFDIIHFHRRKTVSVFFHQTMLLRQVINLLMHAL